MITHYDMTTGEVIEDGDREQPVTTAAHADGTMALRLLSVHEAVATQKPKIRLPADVAALPVDTLIARWS